MGQRVLTAKTSASVQKQLFEAIEAENQLLAGEQALKKNKERYLSTSIGFVADHLEYGCQEGVQIFKVSQPPLESFVALRMKRTQSYPALNKIALLAKVNNVALSLLAAVDLKQTGTVERLYLADQDYLWSMDLTEMHHGQPLQYRLARLADVKHLSHLQVVPDAHGKGVRLYFLAEHAHKQGLFMINDCLNSTEVLSEITTVAEGRYDAFFMRFGRIILLPSDSPNKPEALDLPFHQPIPVSLNASCQLNLIVDCIHEDKLGRIAWRKIK